MGIKGIIGQDSCNVSTHKWHRIITTTTKLTNQTRSQKRIGHYLLTDRYIPYIKKKDNESSSQKLNKARRTMCNLLDCTQRNYARKQKKIRFKHVSSRRKWASHAYRVIYLRFTKFRRKFPN